MGVRILDATLTQPASERQRLVRVHRTGGGAVSRFRCDDLDREQNEALGYLLNVNGYPALASALASLHPGGWTILDGRHPEQLLSDLPPRQIEPTPLYSDEDKPSSPETWLRRPPTWLLSGLVVLLVGLGGLAIMLSGGRNPFELLVAIVVLVAGGFGLFRFARMTVQRRAATVMPGALAFDPEIHAAESIPAVEAILLLRQTDAGWEAVFWHCGRGEAKRRIGFELDRAEAQRLLVHWGQPEWRPATIEPEPVED